MEKQLYFFGGGTADGDASLREILGGKGANLAEMTRLGLPVPPGFTLATHCCLEYRISQTLEDSLRRQIEAAIGRVEDILERGFGDPQRPLLFSVRSGAAVSMPGMMDTVLNLGLNDQTVEALATATDNPRFAHDSYRRFLQMYGNVVLGISGEHFSEALDALKEERGVELDTELKVEDLRLLQTRYRTIIAEAGKSFPQDPYEQLWGAVEAVFRSWDNPRARSYRRMNSIPDDGGTAVSIQAMVFGNLGSTSATGVAFSRNPSTGERAFFGEFLLNAQGEDVVAGVRTPAKLREAEGGATSLEAIMPASFAELTKISDRLEAHYRDMQDLEFTIQEGRLFMLQARSGKRTGPAAVRMAVEMVDEGLILAREAVGRVDEAQLEQLLHPGIDPEAESECIGRGLAASPGAASGEIVFRPEEAVEAAAEGRSTILVRRETSPEDIEGMEASAAFLTQRGGTTSHAAVVARGMGKCCITGCEALRFDEAAGTMSLGGHTLRRGDRITLNGNTGEILLGEVPTVEPKLGGDFERLIGWANEVRLLRVRANADSPLDARRAREFGAEGIGLCRTEHMFFGAERIAAMREMIVARDLAERERALTKLLPHQISDFRGIFEAMSGLPVTIRLLDPPLHEFLPHEDLEIRRLAEEMEVSFEEMQGVVDALHEVNPMLGHRGCRLGLSFPEIYAMQAEAVIRAALLANEAGFEAQPEIMIPLVGLQEELRRLRKLVVDRVEAVLAETGAELHYLVGTMIEIPRACLVAPQIAEEADFFSFGTNDLTQMGFGFSRDDVRSFLPAYVGSGILPGDPFVSLDQSGIGRLVEMATAEGRLAKPDLKVGVCGEHGGDPASVRFFHRVGLDYVSCSPYRVPVAILAAARATLEESGI